MNPMTKAIVYDLGKVLVDFDYSIAARKLARRASKLTENITDFFGLIPLLLRYEVGQLSSQEFYQAFCSATGYEGDFAEFGGSFGDIFSPITAMVDLQAQLRHPTLPAFIFSNTNELAIQHIRRLYPFFKNFDGYILSYEHGSMKPEPRLYEIVEQQTGRRGAEILYLDDRPENIVVGSQRGWQTILHETPEKTRLAIRQLGLLKQ